MTPAVLHEPSSVVSRHAGWLIALLAGAAMPWSLAPLHWWPLAIICPALLYAVSRHASPGQAFWRAQAFGFGLWAVGVFWLFNSIYYYADTPLPIALLMIGIVGMVMGLFHGVMGWLWQRWFGGQPLAFAGLWVIAEWLKTWLFTGFPWLFTGYAFTSEPLAGFAPLLGVFGISLLAVLSAVALVEGLGRLTAGKSQRRQAARGITVTDQRMALAWLALLPACWLTGWALQSIRWTQPQGTPLPVSLIQGNIPQDLKWLASYQDKTLAIYENLSRSEWGQPLVVWPEASIPLFQTEASEFIEKMDATARHFRSSWVTGVPYQAVEETTTESDYTPFYNAIMAGGYAGQGLYRKQRLVPFGEYVPLEGALKWLLPSLKRNPDVSSFSAGLPFQPLLQIQRNLKLGSALCYEVAYPNITRQNAIGSDLMLTISNDAWFGTTSGPHQHLQMVQMRARETGRWFIRATNTGITAIIDDQGHIRQTIPQFTRGVLRGQAQPMQGQTPYVRWGDLPALGLAVACLLPALWRRRTRTDRQQQ